MVMVVEHAGFILGAVISLRNSSVKKKLIVVQTDFANRYTRRPALQPPPRALFPLNKGKITPLCRLSKLTNLKN